MRRKKEKKKKKKKKKKNEINEDYRFFLSFYIFFR